VRCSATTGFPFLPSFAPVLSDRAASRYDHDLLWVLRSDLSLHLFACRLHVVTGWPPAARVCLCVHAVDWL
jgi:hypothetical protein